MPPVIGTRAQKGRSTKVVVDPAALLASHLAVIASSGGGKSWLLRRLLEQTFGLFPHIVIDPEGELKTLREKFDYVIASADDEGDCLAHPRTARLLALRLLELNASCIIDIYELNPDEKVMFVKEFVFALVAAPKELWGPRLVVIDEAHQFVPEKNERGQASRSTVISLLDKGRKRGLSVVLASQRLSKVSKDALSECRNKMYGFCNLPADRKRATEDLGFLTKADQELFRLLDTGQFYAVGPAISKREVIKINVGDVITTHPRPGEGIVAHTPPPKAKVKRFIKELGNLPKQAKKEAETLKEAKAEIKELQREARELKKSGGGGASKQEVTDAHNGGYRDGVEAGQAQVDAAWDENLRVLNENIATSNGGFNEAVENFLKFQSHLKDSMGLFRQNLLDIRSVSLIKPFDRMTGAKKKGPKFAPKKPAFKAITGRTPSDKPNFSNPPRAMASNGDRDSMRKPLLYILDSLAWWATVGQHAPDRRKVAFVAGYKVGGNFNNLVSSLKTDGYVEYDGGTMRLTKTGELLAQSPAHEPDTQELQKLVRMKLKGPQNRVLDAVISMYPEEIPREQLAEMVGYRIGGNFNNIVSALKSLGLVVASRGTVKADEMLFVE